MTEVKVSRLLPVQVKSQDIFDAWVSKLRHHRLYRQNEIVRSPREPTMRTFPPPAAMETPQPSPIVVNETKVSFFSLYFSVKTKICGKNIYMLTFIYFFLYVCERMMKLKRGSSVQGLNFHVNHGWHGNMLFGVISAIFLAFSSLTRELLTSFVKIIPVPDKHWKVFLFPDYVHHQCL